MKIKQKRTVSRSKVEQMTSSLRDQIRTGLLKPEEFLPSELALCKQYNLSNITVRKGLDILVSEGYIEKVPRIGTRVILQHKTADVVLRFGYYSSFIQETHMFEMLESFQQKHPNIQVQPVGIRFPYDNDQTKIRSIVESNDVLMINAFNFEQMVGLPGSVHTDIESILEPLQSKQNTFPFLDSMFTRDGILYGQAYVFSPVVLCYNKDHFKEQQLSEPDSSWTWDDVKEVGTLLSKNSNRFGLYFHLPAETRWLLFLLQNGVRFERGKNNKYNLHEAKLIESLKCIKDIVSDRALFPSFFSDNESDETSLFINQKISMVLTAYDRLYQFHEAPFTYDIAPLPYLNQPKTLLNSIALTISAQSQNKMAAQILIDYMLSYESQVEIRKHTTRIPALKRAAEWSGEEKLTNRPSRFLLFRDIIPTFHSYLDLNMSYTDLVIMRDELKYYWSGMDSLEIVLQRLEEKL
ncbi:MAG: extracellular solute-binding protein [Paenibacillus sp.]|nr:extracellular solute-binding protein [Paenibacillus sp.]